MKNNIDALVFKNGGWVVNHGSTFPLTLIGIEKTIAIEIKKILDKDYSEHVIEELGSNIMHHKITCKEIEDYVNKFKPIYQETIDELMKSSEEWRNSDKDKEDLLSEFEDTATKTLDIHPWGCDIAVLFSWPDVMLKYYYRQIAILLSHTYTMAKYAMEDKNQVINYKKEYGENVSKYLEILTAGDEFTCRYCKRMAKKKYLSGEYPNIPLHIGCRCTVVMRD